MVDIQGENQFEFSNSINSVSRKEGKALILDDKRRLALRLSVLAYHNKIKCLDICV